MTVTFNDGHEMIVACDKCRSDFSAGPGGENCLVIQQPNIAPGRCVPVCPYCRTVEGPSNGRNS